MKIIYHCFGGTHSSIIAAALHLDWLPRARLPRAEEIQAIPYFDQRRRGEEGQIKFLGCDSYGNEIYAVGKRGMGILLENFLYDLTDALGLPREELLLVDTTPLVNCWMALGGFLSRRLGLTFLGRPLVIWGVRRAYYRLVNLVENLRSLPLPPPRASSSSPKQVSRLLIFTSPRTPKLALAAADSYLRSKGCSPINWEKNICKTQPGRLIFVGRDPRGLKVYVAVIGSYFDLLCQIVKDFLSLWDIEGDIVRLVPS